MGLPVSNYGRRLLPQVVDEAARENPNRIVYTVPHLDDKKGDAFEDVSAFKFANGINRLARWIESSFGRGTNFEAVGYIGPHDLTYPMFVLACVKTGYKALLISPRNSLEGSLAVVDRTDCRLWIKARKPNAMVDQVLEKREMTVFDMPALDEIMDVTPVGEYPYTKTFDQAKLDPFAVLHTSGSTGLPKPIVMRMGTVASGDAIKDIELEEGEEITPSWEGGDIVFNPFPWFHAASLMVKLGLNFWLGSRIVTEPTNGVISADTIDRIVSKLPVRACFLPPSTVEELAKTPDTLAKLSQCKYIITGGGALSSALGDIVNKVVSVRNVYGSTEGGIWAMVAPTKQDWRTFKFPKELGPELREVTPGQFELVFVKKPEYSRWQGLFYTFPEDTEYSTKDLFQPHPTEPNRWLCIGRADDVIVLSNGEKVQPVDIEAIISTHPAVLNALVVGQRRFHPALLLDLKGGTPSHEFALEALKDKIYAEVIEKANAISPSHARILKGNILFTVAGKPFLRTDKGTVKRPGMLQLYAAEIDEFYEKQEAEEAKLLSSAMDISSPAAISQSLRLIIGKLLKKELTDSDNLFEAGFDSLLVFQVLGALRTAAERSKKKVQLAPTIIYSNPTVEKVSKAFYAALNPHVNGFVDPHKAHIKLAGDILTRYMNDMGFGDETVIVTGTTGSLGSYMLHGLLAKPTVKKIYCFNRAPDAEDRQQKMAEARGLTATWAPKKVQFLHADLSKPDFGVGAAKYNVLLKTVTKVIHNQWPVNFNWDLSSFEPHIRGVRHLIDFSVKSTNKSSIFFISSIGSITKWAKDEAVPEKAIHDLSVAGMQGYSTSKLMAENLLEQAAVQAGVNASICRVGQIAGPVNSEKGEWSKQEWFPTILATSKYLKLLPSNLGSLDRIEWIPVDSLAEIILELNSLGIKKKAVPAGTNELNVYHATNPRSAYWKDISPVVLNSLPVGTKMVPWAEWVQALKDTQFRKDFDARDVPGLKLLDFYESLVHDEASKRTPFNMDTSITQSKSNILQAMPPVTNEWVELWMKQWNF